MPARQKIKSIEIYLLLLGYTDNITFLTEMSFHFFLLIVSFSFHIYFFLILPSAGSGAEPQSQTVLGEYLIKWSSFSSTVYHIRKTAQEFEQVDDVQFNSGIYRRRLHAWPAAPYNKVDIKLYNKVNQL